MVAWDLPTLLLDLRVEVEEGLNAQAQLFLDRFPRALKNVHRYVSFVAVLQSDRSIAYARDFVSRKQTHSVHQCQICHNLDSFTDPPVTYVSRSSSFARGRSKIHPLCLPRQT